MSLLCALVGNVKLAAAQAQVSLNTPIRENPRPSNESPMAINRHDYDTGAEIEFPLTLANFQGYSLEAWSGFSPDARCTLSVERSGANPRCCRVWSGQATNAILSLTLTAKEILGDPLCQHAGGGDSAQPLYVYFMLLKASDNEADGSHGVWETKFDLLGPPPPIEVSAGIGEEQLVVNWKTEEGDINGYRVYCEQAQTSASSQDQEAREGAGGSGAVSGAGGTGNVDAGGGGSAGTGTGGSAGTGTGGTSGDGSGGSSGSDDGGSGGSGGTPTVNSECPTEKLRGGVAPHPDLKPCGNVDGKRADEALAKGLKNGKMYGVAVAAVDLLGNSGPLSEIACGKPQPIDDFFELYRRAGGKGGGGFCAFSPTSVAPASAAILALGFAFFARRRYSKRGRGSC